MKRQDAFPARLVRKAMLPAACAALLFATAPHGLAQGSAGKTVPGSADAAGAVIVPPVTDPGMAKPAPSMPDSPAVKPPPMNVDPDAIRKPHPKTGINDESGKTKGGALAPSHRDRSGPANADSRSATHGASASESSSAKDNCKGQAERCNRDSSR